MIDQIYLDRLEALSQLMLTEGLQAIIITGDDPHSSEYPLPVFNDRQWICGFGGSAGTFVAWIKEGKSHYALWTDSRYHLEAGRLFEGSPVRLMARGLPGVPELIPFLCNELTRDSRVGVDRATLSLSQFESWQHQLKTQGISLIAENSLTDRLPFPPSREALYHAPFELPAPFCSASRKERLSLLRAGMQETGADHCLVTALDSIAYLLNLRGGDIPYNPVFYAYLLVSQQNVLLYLNAAIADPLLCSRLESDGIQLQTYPDHPVEFQLPGDLSGTLILDPRSANAALDSVLEQAGLKRITAPEVFRKMAERQACRSPGELEWTGLAMECDAVALLRLEIEVERALAAGEPVFESDVAVLSDRLRGEAAVELSEKRGLSGLIQELPGAGSGDLYDSFYLGPGFEPIAAAGANGAVVHYRPGEGEPVPVRLNEPLLLDSGGQYLFGTTDITRVFYFQSDQNQTPSSDYTTPLREAYTRVLKGHLALVRQRFPAGTPGCRLDAFARAPLWEAGLDYLHGTGHGVGFALNVHEGPQSVSPRLLDQPLLPGMVISNEPGYYAAGEYGIRIENLLAVIESKKPGFLEFRNLTLYPYERALVDNSLLTREEREQINLYHRRIMEKISPHLSPAEKIRLAQKCEAL